VRKCIWCHILEYIRQSHTLCARRFAEIAQGRAGEEERENRRLRDCARESGRRERFSPAQGRAGEEGEEEIARLREREKRRLRDCEQEIAQGRAGEQERESEIVRGDVGGPRPTYRMGCVDIYVCDLYILGFHIYIST